MIKIHYKGYDIEVSSVDELNQIIGTPKTYSNKDKTVEEVKRPYTKRKKRNIIMVNRWSDEEMNKIFTMLNDGNTIKDVAREPLLRSRHSKNAINQMTTKVMFNRPEAVGKHVEDLISIYHASPARHLAVKHE